jgi:hypothetical protein
MRYLTRQPCLISYSSGPALWLQSSYRMQGLDTNLYPRLSCPGPGMNAYYSFVIMGHLISIEKRSLVLPGRAERRKNFPCTSILVFNKIGPHGSLSREKNEAGSLHVKCDVFPRPLPYFSNEIQAMFFPAFQLRCPNQATMSEVSIAPRCYWPQVSKV